MATIQFKKGDEYLLKLSLLEKGLKDQVIGGAIYDAAGFVTDQIRQELNSIPTDQGYGTTEDPLHGPSKAQKQGMLDGLGITKMRDDGTGYVNVKVGFDGYNNLKTKRWPQGQPNQMVARSVERGTSFMAANPFVKRAMRKARKPALETMRLKIDAAIQNIMEG